MQEYYSKGFSCESVAVRAIYYSRGMTRGTRLGGGKWPDEHPGKTGRGR